MERKGTIRSPEEAQSGGLLADARAAPRQSLFLRIKSPLEVVQLPLHSIVHKIDSASPVLLYLCLSRSVFFFLPNPLFLSAPLYWSLSFLSRLACLQSAVHCFGAPRAHDLS